MNEEKRNAICLMMMSMITVDAESLPFEIAVQSSCYVFSTTVDLQIRATLIF